MKKHVLRLLFGSILCFILSFNLPVLAQEKSADWSIGKQIEKLEEEIVEYNKKLQQTGNKLSEIERNTITWQRDSAQKTLFFLKRELQRSSRKAEEVKAKPDTDVSAEDKTTGNQKTSKVISKCEEARKYTRPSTHTYPIPLSSQKIPLGAKNPILLMRRLEAELIKHLVKCEEKWTRKLQQEWDEKRKKIITALLEAEKRMFEVASGGYTKAEEKKLNQIYGNNYDIWRMERDDAKLYAKFARLFNKAQELIDSGYHKQPDSPDTKFAVEQAIKLAEMARDDWYKHARKLAELKRSKKSEIDKVKAERIQRGIKTFQERFPNIKFRSHSNNDFLRLTDEVRHLLGEKGVEILNEQNKRRFKVGSREIAKD